MKPTFPLKLLAPGVGAILTLLVFAGEQFANTQAWWTKMPWLEISTFLGGLFLGAAYADLCNPRSQWRAWWKYRKRPFDVVAISTDHTWHDTRRQGTERVEIWCILQFLRDLSDPLLTIRAIGPLEIAEDRWSTTVVFQERLGEIAKDSKRRFVLGNIGISRPMSHEDQAKAKSEGRSIMPHPTKWSSGEKIIPHSLNRIEISMDGYIFKVLAKFIEQSDRTGRVLLIREDEAML